MGGPFLSPRGRLASGWHIRWQRRLSCKPVTTATWSNGANGSTVPQHGAIDL
jgi:hypothetical protein